MSRNKFRIKERFTFFLERRFVRGVHYQLLIVAMFIGLISLIGGLLVWPLTDESEGVEEAVWWAFLRLSDPGYLGDDEGIWRRTVSTVLTVLGYVVFLGSLVAIITSWLNRKIRFLEQGLTPLVADNHVLILGWTNRTIHIAAELFLSVGRVRGFLKRYGAKKLKLVILTEDVSTERVQELKEHRMIAKRANEIVLRSGSSIDRDHLRRVDSLNAAAIIIPSQSRGSSDLITPDVETIKTLLSLNAESIGSKRMPFVVAEIQDENKLRAAYRAYSGPLEVISSDIIISRLVAQNVRHPGLSAVYNELLSRQVKNNLYAVDMPEAEGLVFGEMQGAFERAVLIGVVRPEGENFKPFLNPPADFVVERSDRPVFIARNLNDIDSSEELPPPGSSSSKPSVAEKRLPTFETEAVTPILILGWNHHVPALVRELATYEEEFYEVTMVSLRPIGERESVIGVHSDVVQRVPCRHIYADHVNESELRALDPSRFHHILLASSDRLADADEADARTIVGAMLIEELIKNAEPRPQILIELSDPSNEMLMRRFQSEVIVGPMMVSHLLAQIALRRELHSIYNELFTVGGAEIIFRMPEEYGLSSDDCQFADLERRAFEYGETALGIYTPGTEGERQSLQLNPNRKLTLKISGDVRMVVITTVY